MRQRWLTEAAAGTVLAGAMVVTPLFGHLVCAQGDPSRAMAARLGQHHLHANPALPAFVFGNFGGLARAVTIQISDSNAVSLRGTIRPRHFRAPPNTSRGLLRLAEAEGFFTMRSGLVCATGNSASGDRTTDFITVHTTVGVKTVQSVGGCGRGFAELFDVLRAVARLSP